MFFGKNKALQKLGYYNDQDGIVNRFYREREHWEEHLNNTKQYILTSAKYYEKKSVALLGSGWLLDVPLAELSAMFGEVFLIDILHPKEIKQKAGRYKNVKFIEIDLTGGAIDYVFEMIKKGSFTKLLPEFAQFSTDYSMVVSLNILSQLDNLVCDKLTEKNICTQDEIFAFRKQIQENHINNLPIGKSCLITDFREEIFGNNGEVMNNDFIFTEIPEGKERKFWKWNFDMTGNYYKDSKTVFDVVALNF